MADDTGRVNSDSGNRCHAYCLSSANTTRCVRAITMNIEKHIEMLSIDISGDTNEELQQNANTAH